MLNFLKGKVSILLIFALGLFLRFFKLQSNLYFSAEFGHNLLAIKDSYFNGTIPLVGPPTSHPWLYFGPLYYWILTPVEIIFDWDPRAAIYFGAFVGALVVLINYFVIKRIFDSKVALISSLLIAISPLWIQFSRLGRFYFLITPLFYLVFWALIRFIRKGKYLWLVGLSFGLMFS